MNKLYVNGVEIRPIQVDDRNLEDPNKTHFIPGGVYSPVTFPHLERLKHELTTNCWCNPTTVEVTS